MFIVMSNTRLPNVAAAFAASHPACPAPTTIISNILSNVNVSRGTSVLRVSLSGDKLKLNDYPGRQQLQHFLFLLLHPFLLLRRLVLESH